MRFSWRRVILNGFDPLIDEIQACQSEGHVYTAPNIKEVGVKKIIVAVFCCICFGFSSYGQENNKPEIIIKNIDVGLSPAPRYTITGQSIPQKAPPVDNSKKWLVIEAELESAPEWADEVTVKFYVVAEYGPGASKEMSRQSSQDRWDVLTASVTIVNMQRNIGTGKKNIVPVFIDASTVKKYGATGVQQFIPEIAVQVMYKGVLQHKKWMKNEQSSGNFWEKKQPKTGILLNLEQSPWFPAFSDHYEQVKPAPSNAGF